MSNKNKRFNLIGFDFDKIDTKEYRHCSIHPYKRLLESKNDASLLFCPECGSEWKKEDTVKEQDIQTEHLPTSETKIVQASKRKKRYTDSMGNPIPTDDKEAMADLASGKTITYYHEQKAEENKDKVAVSIRKYKGVSWSDLM